MTFNLAAYLCERRVIKKWVDGFHFMQHFRFPLKI